MTLNTDNKDFGLTKYERARIIGSRALQISMGAKPALKLTEKKLKELKFNPVEIAKLEFDENKIPIDVKRILPHERKALKNAPKPKD